MGAFNKIQAFRFSALLAKPFEKWDAFTLGIIDEDGNVVKKPSTPEEKKSLDAFENLVRKIKKILLKYIPNKKLFSFLIAAYLLKTESDSIIISEINNKLDENELKILHNVLSTQETLG